MSQDIRRWAILLSVFAILASLPWLIGYLRRDQPTPEEACRKKCEITKREGHLVYRGPATSKDTSLYRTCECR